MTFKAYKQNVEAKTRQDHFRRLWRIATEKGFIEDGKIVATHASAFENGLKADIGLGHVHANFVIAYLRLRT